MYPDDVAHIESKGRTVLGSHKPIMVTEILNALQLTPGALAVDLTLGFGGHTTELLNAVGEKGRVVSFDQDPLEFQKTEQRLGGLGFHAPRLELVNRNFRYLNTELQRLSITGFDALLGDLGLSSMQIDLRERGFSLKFDSPLDLRMNPMAGKPAADLLLELSVDTLSEIFSQFGDEPFPHKVAVALSAAAREGKLKTTHQLRDLVIRTVKRISGYPLDPEKAPTRILQAIRIHVNGELAALSEVLEQVPRYARPGARVAFLSFHSGEDRLVKKFFQNGLKVGRFSEIHGPIQATPEEVRANRRAKSAKLRFGVVKI